jgi:hypothetical protein
MLRAMTEGAPRNLDVPPGPVRGPRGGSQVGAAVLIGLVAVVAGAVGIAQLAPAPLDPAHRFFAPPTVAPPPASVPEAPPASEPAPAPDPSAVIAGTTPRLGREALAAAVSGGQLDGRLVFVDGALDVTPVRCQSLAQGLGGCVDLVIPGLGLPVWQGEAAVPWRADPPPGAWLVTVARAGGLVYLGSLVPRGAAPTSFSAVPVGGTPERHGTLFEVAGYLVRNPIHTCYRPGGSATPCPPPPPFLAEDEPLPEGLLTTDAGVEVGLAASIPEVDPDAIVVSGTFLVQREPGQEGSWRVIARYVPSRAVRVLVP